jgi:hypothetical protein
VVFFVGSSTFLKSRFGLGYLLTMEKKNESQSADGVDDLIRGHIPKAVQATHVGTELSYKLPHQDSDKFADMLEVLSTCGGFIHFSQQFFIIFVNKLF